VEGGSYFFTVVTERRQPIITEEPIRHALREAIMWVREKYPFEIDGWVLLPDHLHTIWTLPAGDADFATRWRLIKTRVTRDCGKLYAQPKFLTARRTAKRCGTLWQHRYWEHALRDDADFEHHMDYLHINPVKHGLVQRVCDWPYSSFHRWVKNGVYSMDWGGNNIKHISPRLE
jgi:putative transposase